VQLQEETAGIAEDGAGFIAAPQWCRTGRAVLADRLDANGQRACSMDDAID
jgi:hypothetical protein